MIDPTFESEKELETALANAIQSAPPANSRVLVLRSFGLDLAVFTEGADWSRTCFFEVKAFAPNHGRCGFGDARGEGNQIRLLYDEAANTPRNQSDLGILDRTVRWVVGNRSMPLQSPRFLFFTCTQAQDAAMGGVRPGKQNNLNLARFGNDDWITWPVLIDRVVTFLRRAE